MMEDSPSPVKPERDSITSIPSIMDVGGVFSYDVRKLKSPGD